MLDQLTSTLLPKGFLSRADFLFAVEYPEERKILEKLGFHISHSTFDPSLGDDEEEEGYRTPPMWELHPVILGETEL